ncbi:hypothetical protein [Mycoplasmopsis gallinacea]|uniref:Uncharacterized protein n=1 Tax=Mycoplasmopsis gallinacea TaxID=29556 RepID=A0A6H0V7J7_9BACT|nr:hypothetical protein [Mycoplasmopsis gallinacea]QIW62465.1 hypothetical protein GOQ20_03535 [Mycoplasmopsis gallinacea]
MNTILKTINKKLKKDHTKLRIYKLLDRLISFIIAVLNISVLFIAIYALIKLVRINTTEADNMKDIKFSFYLILVFVIFIICSFILTIALEVYKNNSRYQEYKKVYNTMEHLLVKEAQGIISEEELIITIDALWEKASAKRKIVIKQIVQNQLEKGPIK